MINDSVRRLDGYKVTLRVMERLSFGRLRPLCWLSNPCLRVRRRRGGSHTGSMGSTRLRKAASFNCRWDTNRTSPQCSSVPPSPKKPVAETARHAKRTVGSRRSIPSRPTSLLRVGHANSWGEPRWETP